MLEGSITMKKKKWISSLGGLVAGTFNGLLGAGGGMIIVPVLGKTGLSPRKAHATSVCVILPICIVSSILYLTSGRVQISDAAPYLLWGAVGSVIGSILLTKINYVWLKRIFGILMIWAAFRMLIR